jgi:hypothetical protein
MKAIYIMLNLDSKTFPEGKKFLKNPTGNKSFLSVIGLSRLRQGFESPWGRQYIGGGAYFF